MQLWWSADWPICNILQALVKCASDGGLDTQVIKTDNVNDAADPISCPAG